MSHSLADQHTLYKPHCQASSLPTRKTHLLRETDPEGLCGRLGPAVPGGLTGQGGGRGRPFFLESGPPPKIREPECDPGVVLPAGSPALEAVTPRVPPAVHLPLPAARLPPPSPWPPAPLPRHTALSFRPRLSCQPGTTLSTWDLGITAPLNLSLESRDPSGCEASSPGKGPHTDRQV